MRKCRTGHRPFFDIAPPSMINDARTGVAQQMLEVSVTHDGAATCPCCAERRGRGGTKPRRWRHFGRGCKRRTIDVFGKTLSSGICRTASSEALHRAAPARGRRTGAFCGRDRTDRGVRRRTHAPSSAARNSRRRINGLRPYGSAWSI